MNNQRSKTLKLWLSIGSVALVVITAVGGYLIYVHFQTASVVWGTSSSGFSSQDQQGITTAIQSKVGTNEPGHQFTVINAQRVQQWAIVSLNERSSSQAQTIATEPLFFIASQQGNNWNVADQSSSNFCSQLSALPTSLLDDGDKQYFLQCTPTASARHSFFTIAGNTRTLASSSPFQLPVLSGVTVGVSQGNNQGDHIKGQQYAFDFTVGTSNVTISAAQSGTVIGENDQSNIQCSGLNYESSPQPQSLKMCWAHANFILIANNDGQTASLYMHLLPGSITIHVGDHAQQGAPLAKAGTTGWSTGVHLHLQAERIPTPQLNPYSGWWWQPSVPLTFSDPSVLRQDPNGIPLTGQQFVKGSGNGTTTAPTLTPTPMPPSVASGQLLWKFDTGAPILSTPASANGIIYVGSTSNYLYAFQGANGAIIWKIHLNLMYSSPIIEGNIIYIGSEDGGLYAINANNGSTLWRYQADGSINTTPIYVNSNLYFNTNTTIFAIRASDGTFLWQYQPPLPPINYASGITILVGSNEVFTSGGTDYLYALDAISGVLRWSVNMTPSSNSYSYNVTVNAVLGNIVYATGGPDLTALNVTDGSLIWLSPNNGINPQGVINNGVLYGSGIGVGVGVEAINISNGSLIWQQQLQHQVLQPIIYNDTIYVGCGDCNYFYALRVADGKVLWQIQTGNWVFSSAAYFDGIVYFTSQDGYVYAVGA